jgi:hypothetical protein
MIQEYREHTYIKIDKTQNKAKYVLNTFFRQIYEMDMEAMTKYTLLVQSGKVKSSLEILLKMQLLNHVRSMQGGFFELYNAVEDFVQAVLRYNRLIDAVDLLASPPAYREDRSVDIQQILAELLAVPPALPVIPRSNQGED